MATKPPLKLSLPPLPPTVKPLRFTQTIKDAGVQDMLNSYLQLYEQTYKKSIDRNTLVEMMIRGFLMSDKAFQSHYRSLSQAPEAIAQRAAEGAKNSGDAEDSPH